MKSKEWVEAGPKKVIKTGKESFGYIKCAFYNIIGKTNKVELLSEPNIDINELDKEFREWLKTHNEYETDATYNAVYALWITFNCIDTIIGEELYTLEYIWKN